MKLTKLTHHNRVGVKTCKMIKKERKDKIHQNGVDKKEISCKEGKLARNKLTNKLIRKKWLGSLLR